MDKNQAPLSWLHVLESSTFVLIAGTIPPLKLSITDFYTHSFLMNASPCKLLLWLTTRTVTHHRKYKMCGPTHHDDDVLKANNVWVVMAMACAYEVVFNRTKRTFQGLFVIMFVTLLLCTCIISTVGIAFALKITPFWTPAKFIPITGMLLGNSMSSIAMATERCLDHVSKHAPLLETRLAYGATRFEAARPLAIESIRLALLPVITQLSVIGLVNIPGTLAGLVLAGAPIRDAVIYQQVIMFMVVASSTFGSILAVVACLKTVIDQNQMLRVDKIYDNKSIVSKDTLTKLADKLKSLRGTACTGRYTKHRYEEVEMS
ncbi:hypothetical protein [Absidia glauca]|uniref:Uncharacterized protein n=1 Tax=Absidia glauca TaxID=4829 RepID=A0A168QRZ5_ABSGL|nr:hypothetical protein [Absidia glauca]